MKRLVLTTFTLLIAVGTALADRGYQTPEEAEAAGLYSSCAAMNGVTVIILATGLCAGLYFLKHRRL